MLGIILSVIIVTGIVSYVIAIFVYDHFRKKRGKPSIFLDQCESEGHGRRLVKAFHKKYGAKSR